MTPNVRVSGRARVMTLLAARDRRASGTPTLKTNAFRLVNGAADGAPPGLTLDIFGGWLVLSARKALSEDTVEEWIECTVAVFEPEGIVVKRLAPRPKDSFSRLVGDRTPPEVLKVFEGDAQLEIHLDDGVQTGLFLDHRETRARARTYARGVEVLNLFAYTCAFSVHAALAGASKVTSVDVSQRALSWGRRNMAHSGLNPNLHRWFSDDVLSHLKRPRRSYGLVVCDPPVFGHGRRPFSLERDLQALMSGCIEQLSNEGVLIFSTHHTALNKRVLIEAASQAALQLKRMTSVLGVHGLPEWDHPVLERDAEGDRGGYLDTVVLRVHDL